jgi:hypothetical protein
LKPVSDRIVVIFTEENEINCPKAFHHLLSANRLSLSSVEFVGSKFLTSSANNEKSQKDKNVFSHIHKIKRMCSDLLIKT